VVKHRQPAATKGQRRARYVESTPCAWPDPVSSTASPAKSGRNTGRACCLPLAGVGRANHDAMGDIHGVRWRDRRSRQCNFACQHRPSPSATSGPMPKEVRRQRSHNPLVGKPVLAGHYWNRCARRPRCSQLFGQISLSRPDAALCPHFPPARGRIALGKAAVRHTSSGSKIKRLTIGAVQRSFETSAGVPL